MQDLNRTATKEDIEEVDWLDGVMATIIATGAARDERSRRMRRCHEMTFRIAGVPHGTIAWMCEILEADLVPPEER